MIPKIIHFVWLGGNKYPELVERCIESWKNILSEYQIMCWNEESFDINSNQYVKEAYENKKYAFASDYIRLYALYNYGGIYMDTDVQVLKPLDEFLGCNAFTGFENYMSPVTGIIGSVKGDANIGALLNEYDNLHFVKEDGSFDFTTNTVRITKYLVACGAKLDNRRQIVNGMIIYPNLWFCPEPEELLIKRYVSKVYTIHHKTGTWIDSSKGSNNTKTLIKKWIKLLIGKSLFDSILRLIRINKMKELIE